MAFYLLHDTFIQSAGPQYAGCKKRNIKRFENKNIYETKELNLTFENEDAYAESTRSKITSSSTARTNIRNVEGFNQKQPNYNVKQNKELYSDENTKEVILLKSLGNRSKHETSSTLTDQSIATEDNDDTDKSNSTECSDKLFESDTKKSNSPYLQESDNNVFGSNIDASVLSETDDKISVANDKSFPLSKIENDDQIRKNISTENIKDTRFKDLISSKNEEAKNPISSVKIIKAKNKEAVVLENDKGAVKSYQAYYSETSEDTELNYKVWCNRSEDKNILKNVEDESESRMKDSLSVHENEEGIFNPISQKGKKDQQVCSESYPTGETDCQKDSHDKDISQLQCEQVRIEDALETHTNEDTYTIKNTQDTNNLKPYSTHLNDKKDENKESDNNVFGSNIDASVLSETDDKISVANEKSFPISKIENDDQIRKNISTGNIEDTQFKDPISSKNEEAKNPISSEKIIKAKIKEAVVSENDEGTVKSYQAYYSETTEDTESNYKVWCNRSEDKSILKNVEDGSESRMKDSLTVQGNEEGIFNLISQKEEKDQQVCSESYQPGEKDSQKDSHDKDISQLQCDQVRIEDALGNHTDEDTYTIENTQDTNNFNPYSTCLNDKKNENNNTIDHVENNNTKSKDIFKNTDSAEDYFQEDILSEDTLPDLEIIEDDKTSRIRIQLQPINTQDSNAEHTLLELDNKISEKIDNQEDETNYENCKPLLDDDNIESELVEQTNIPVKIDLRRRSRSRFVSPCNRKDALISKEYSLYKRMIVHNKVKEVQIEKEFAAKMYSKEIKIAKTSEDENFPKQSSKPTPDVEVLDNSLPSSLNLSGVRSSQTIGSTKHLILGLDIDSSSSEEEQLYWIIFAVSWLPVICLVAAVGSFLHIFAEMENS